MYFTNASLLLLSLPGDSCSLDKEDNSRGRADCSSTGAYTVSNECGNIVFRYYHISLSLSLQTITMPPLQGVLSRETTPGTTHGIINAETGPYQ